MKESALQLRRRCLFLFQKEVLAVPLQRPDVVTRADAILRRWQAVQSTEFDDGVSAAVAALAVPLHRWVENHHFADWEECVEWLLFMVDQVEREHRKCFAALGDLSRDMLHELIALFAEEAHACDTTEATFSENYWRSVWKCMQPRVGEEYGGDDNKTEEEACCVPTRVSWSIAANLPLDVEQVFLSP